MNTYKVWYKEGNGHKVWTLVEATSANDAMRKFPLLETPIKAVKATAKDIRDSQSN